MKKFVTLLAIAAFSFGVSAISFAQDAGPQGGRIQNKSDRKPGAGVRLMVKFQKDVLDGLNLSDDQKKKIDDLNKSIADQVKAIQDSNKGTEGNKNIGAQRRKVMQDYSKNLQDILTPDQWRSYREQMLTKMKEARERREARQGSTSSGGKG
jgi:Spy/CpxP family protein refolding chaperone